jgi:UDP-N-acetylglucosamine acyltransferase
MSTTGLRVIHPKAKIGRNVTIEPFVTIGANVVIGDDSWIGANATIMEGVSIGKNCKIFPGAVVGAIPQDLKFEGEHSFIEIGDNVIIREYCTLNRGTKANQRTIIGDDCLLMAYVHVAHDCVLGKGTILANNVNLAGHIEIGDYSTLGGLTAVHQFVKIGAYAMIGGGALVRKDVPPFIKAAREPLSYAGINSIGLRRHDFSKDQVHLIQDIYRYLFVKGFNVSQAVEKIKKHIPKSAERKAVLSFIKKSERGLLRGFRQLNGNKLNGNHIK